MFGGQALTKLATRDLERLLALVHRGELVCPIDELGIHTAGLSYLVDKLGFLKGLPEPAVRAALVAVLAERRAQTATLGTPRSSDST